MFFPIQVSEYVFFKQAIGTSQEVEDCTICLSSLVNQSVLRHVFKTSQGEVGGFHQYHVQCLKTWFSQKSSEEFLRCPDCKKRAITDLQSAAEAGHMEAFKHFWQETLPSKSEVLEAFKKAASQGCVPIVEHCLSSPFIDSEDQGDAVIWAAIHNHLDVIETVLANKRISQWHREQAVMSAACRGNTVMIKRLLREGVIDEAVIKDLVVKALQEQDAYAEGLKTLLPKVSVLFCIQHLRLLDSLAKRPLNITLLSQQKTNVYVLFQNKI